MVFTGTKRSRPTSISREPSKTSMAAPIAVSTWTTSGVDVSPGSTCLTLRISGRPRMPWRTSSACFIAARSNHRLLVEQNRCRSRSASAVLSSSSVWAVSRSTIRPSVLRRAKWPPLRSEGVRRTASIANGAPAGRTSRPPGRRAPRRGCRSWRRRRAVAGLDQPVEQAGAAQRGVEVAVAGRAPLEVGVLRPADRREVLGEELGLLVLQELQRQALDRQVVVARQRRHGVGGGAEAVHEDQRQRGVVLLAEVRAPGGR